MGDRLGDRLGCCTAASCAANMLVAAAFAWSSDDENCIIVSRSSLKDDCNMASVFCCFSAKTAS
jgi:hypothetical protein